MNTAPTRSDILALIGKNPRTSASIKSLYPREHRVNISSDIVFLLRMGLIEECDSGFDGPTLRITEKGRGALDEL